MAKKDDYQLRQQAESDWRNSQQIREEFDSLEAYFHYLRATENNLVKVFGGKK